MTDLTEWLREQISVTERCARKTLDQFVDPHIAYAASRAALAHCEAHTKILDLYAAEVNDGDHGTLCGLGAAVDALGLAYQHRPGYRPEWRP